MNIEDWIIVPGDKALRSALAKEKKRRQDDSITILDYQKNNLNEALTYVENFNVAIDAGANYGLMSYSLNEKFSRIHAFEVDTRVRDCLKQNIDKFNLDRVTVYDCGLSDKEETVSLTYRKNTFGTSVNKSQDGEFLCKTIDSFNFQDMNFIKIDCEGYEPYILRGAEQTIKKYKPVILMEDKNYSGRYYGEEGNLAVDLLLDWGYTMAVSWPKDCVMIYKG
jgi:FkbM family methyltransferase